MAIASRSARRCLRASKLRCAKRWRFDVVCAATHGIFSGPAIDRLKNSRISEVVVTNTLPIPPDKQFDKLTVLSVAPILAAAIRAVFDDSTVSGLFDGSNT